jgi:hypothetical protein
VTRSGLEPGEMAGDRGLPERAPETKFTRATPLTVSPLWSIRLRLVKKNTAVPSGTKVPAGSMRMAVTTDTPPLATTNVGFAISVMLVPGAAVRGTDSQAIVPKMAPVPARTGPSASVQIFDIAVLA